MAVITKLVKGYSPDYPFKEQGRWAGDYFDVKGEPQGRRWGKGAQIWTGHYNHPEIRHAIFCLGKAEITRRSRWPPRSRPGARRSRFSAGACARQLPVGRARKRSTCMTLCRPPREVAPDLGDVGRWHADLHDLVDSSSRASFPDWPTGVALGIGGLAGAYAGARIQRRLPDVLIRRVMGVLVIGIGARYLWVGLG